MQDFPLHSCYTYKQDKDDGYEEDNLGVACAAGGGDGL